MLFKQGHLASEYDGFVTKQEIQRKQGTRSLYILITMNSFATYASKDRLDNYKYRSEITVEVVLESYEMLNITSLIQIA